MMCNVSWGGTMSPRERWWNFLTKLTGVRSWHFARRHFKLTGSTWPVYRKLIAYQVVGHVDADIAGDGVVVDFRFPIVHLVDVDVVGAAAVVQGRVCHENTTQQHADPQHINLKPNEHLIVIRCN